MPLSAGDRLAAGMDASSRTTARPDLAPPDSGRSLLESHQGDRALWVRGRSPGSVLDNVETAPQRQPRQRAAQPGAPESSDAPAVLWQRGEQRRGPSQEGNDASGYPGKGLSEVGAASASGAVLWRREEEGPSALAFPPPVDDDSGAAQSGEGPGDDLWSAPQEGSAAAAGSGDRSPTAWVRLHASLEARGNPSDDPWREGNDTVPGQAGLNNGAGAQSGMPAVATSSGQDAKVPSVPVSRQNGGARPALGHGQEGLGGVVRGHGMGEDTVQARHRAAVLNNVEVMVGSRPPPQPPALR